MREVSRVRSCGCDMCLWCWRVLRIRVLLLLLRLVLLRHVAPLSPRLCAHSFFFMFLFFLLVFHVCSLFPHVSSFFLFLGYFVGVFMFLIPLAATRIRDAALASGFMSLNHMHSKNNAPHNVPHVCHSSLATSSRVSEHPKSGHVDRS